MSDTKITFEFPFTDADGKSCNSQVRVVTIDGNPWFVARDVSLSLGLYEDNTNSFTRLLGNDEKTRYPIRTPGGRQSMVVVSESGLYKLIMRSDKPQARAFQDWVTREVLPRIRKDGAYVIGEEKHGSVEDTVKAMYRAMQEKVKRLRAEADAKSKEAKDILDKADILTSAMAVLCEDMAEAA